MNELFSRGTKNWDEDWLKLTQCSTEKINVSIVNIFLPFYSF